MPKICVRTPEDFAAVRQVISEVCDKLGLELMPPGQDQHVSIENSAFVIADLTPCEPDWPLILCDLGYAIRASKIVFLISGAPENAPKLGQEGVLGYDRSDLQTFRDKLAADLTLLCRQERIRHNRLPDLPPLDDRAPVPVLRKYDARVDNYVSLGDAFVDDGNYEDARREYGRAILHIGASGPKPQHAPIFFKRAFALKKLRQTQEALEDYDQAIQLQPDFVDVHIGKGVTLYELGRYREALENFRRASELKPDFTRAYVLAGLMLRLTGDFEQSIEQLDRAIQLSPRFPDAYYNRGLVRSDMREYERAIEDFSTAIVLNDTYKDAFISRGLAHMDLKQYDSAIQDFDRAIALDPQCAEAYGHRGQALFEKGYREFHALAIENWQKAIELGAPQADQLAEKIRATTREV